MQSFFGQFFKGRILLTADDLAICKSFDAEIHKIDPCLYFVLVVLSRGVGNADISKVGIVRTVLTLILLTAKIINETFRLVQSIFRQIRAVDDLKALGRWVKRCDKTVRNRVAVFVLIQNNTHRYTVVVFLLDVLLKLIRTGVLDAFTDLAVRAEIVNPADRFGLDGCFLRGGNHGAGNAFTVLQSVDLYVVPSVGQHCKVGFQAVLRKSHHRDTGVVIDGTSRLCQVKSCPYDFCIISIGFKKVTHLIQYKAVRIVRFDFKIVPIKLRKMFFLRYFAFCLRYEGVHRILASADAFGIRVGVFFQYGVVFGRAEVNKLRLGVFVKVFKEAVRAVRSCLCFGYKVIGQMGEYKLTARCCVRIIIDCFKLTGIGTVKIVVVIPDRCCVRVGVRFLPFRCFLNAFYNTLRQVWYIVDNLTFRGDMGNVLIVPIDLHGTVPNGQSVAEIAHPDVELDRLFFGLFISDLQMVIQWVLLHLAVEFSSRHFLVEKRKLRIIEHYTLIIKGQDFILVCAEIDGAAEMVFVSLVFRLRLFGRCGRQDFSVPSFLGKCCTAFLLLLQPFRILCLFLGVQVTVEFYQLGNALLYLTPFQVDMRFIASDAFRNTDAFAVVLLINIGSDNSRIDSAPAVFIF